MSSTGQKVLRVGSGEPHKIRIKTTRGQVMAGGSRAVFSRFPVARHQIVDFSKYTGDVLREIRKTHR